MTVIKVKINGNQQQQDIVKFIRENIKRWMECHEMINGLKDAQNEWINDKAIASMHYLANIFSPHDCELQKKMSSHWNCFFFLWWILERSGRLMKSRRGRKKKLKEGGTLGKVKNDPILLAREEETLEKREI